MDNYSSYSQNNRVDSVLQPPAPSLSFEGPASNQYVYQQAFQTQLKQPEPAYSSDYHSNPSSLPTYQTVSGDTGSGHFHPQYVPNQLNGFNNDVNSGFQDFSTKSSIQDNTLSCKQSANPYSQTYIAGATPLTSLTPGFPNYDRWKKQSFEPWTWQILPDGLIYTSYLAGPREPRLGAVWNYERNQGWIWDATAGGRAPLIRYGSKHSVLPEGFQIDVEGAAMVRLDYERELDLLGADFRAGLPITFGTKTTQYKLAYYHVSSHMGDEYLLRTDRDRNRINYVRDALVFGVSFRISRDFRIYGETAWAFFTGEKTEPWEFQFGFEYSPIYPANGAYGSPFFAINTQLFQELDFSGNLKVQFGWQWRGASNHMFRVGGQYFCGSSDQFQYNQYYESKVGFGVWYDF